MPLHISSSSSAVRRVLPFAAARQNPSSAKQALFFFKEDLQESVECTVSRRRVKLSRGTKSCRTPSHAADSSQAIASVALGRGLGWTDLLPAPRLGPNHPFFHSVNPSRSMTSAETNRREAKKPKNRGVTHLTPLFEKTSFLILFPSPLSISSSNRLWRAQSRHDSCTSRDSAARFLV